MYINKSIKGREVLRGFVNFIIKNKLAVWLMTFIIVIFGMYSGTKMKTETIPDISIPFLMVNDVYPGATPEQVMEEVSIPLEKMAENLDHVKAVYSNSYANMSSIQIEYEYGIDMDEAKRNLRSALDDITLPEDAQKPAITEINMNMMPVIALSISSETEDIVELTSTVEEIILPKLQKLDGVSSASITGQHIEEVIVTYDEEKLEQLALSTDDVKDIVQASDLALQLGLYEFDDAEQAVAVDGKATSIEDLKEMLIPVTPTEENPVPFVALGDIATVEKIGKVQSVSRTNGLDSISVQVLKGQQANTVDVVNEVKDLINEEMDQIDGLVIDVSLDQGEPIENSVKQMIEKAIFGALIAMLIILIFLRDIRSTIISVISIPVSIFTALLLLHAMDITLNLMTLGAITVAIGRVIDDSIVVVENIYRRLHLKEEKLTGIALVREATLEMFKPIASSTFVTIAVFAPLIFVGGMVGELFIPFALTMAFALGASLVVAITIVPALSHTLFKKKLYAEKTEQKHKEHGKITQTYKSILNWTLNHKFITSTIAILLLAGSVALTPIIGFSFLGSEEEKVMYLTYTPKTGELQDETLENIAEIEDYLLENKDIDIIQLSVNNEADAMSMMMGGGANGGLMYVIFDPDITDFPKQRDEIEAYVKNIDQSGEWKSQDFSSMGFSSDEITYSFYSENLDRLNDALQLAEDALADIDHIKDVSTTAEDVFVEHVLETDQNELMQLGLTTGQIAMALNNQQSKEVLTTLDTDDQTIEVIVQSEQHIDPTSIEDLLKTEIETALGDTIPLSEIVTVREDTTLNALSRSKGEYYGSVTGTITSEDITKVTADADKAIEKLDLAKGVTYDIGGVAADMEETFSQLIMAMLAAILIVYFILVVTFGEGTAPFAVLFSLPFTVIGSFVGLLLAKETISVTVMMGLLMLIGIVVTNAIVLVDRIIRMEKDGMDMREAVLEGGMTRLRPILMTAIATIGALIPLALGNGGGGGGLISKDLAITVIGGLTSSTLLTLIIVPIVYEMLSKLTKKDRKNIANN